MLVKFRENIFGLGQRLWEVEIVSFEVLEIIPPLTITHLPAICDHSLVIVESRESCERWRGINRTELNMGVGLMNMT